MKNTGRPLAAALRDLRTGLLSTLTTDDRRTPCRRYQAVLIVDGSDTCESVADAATAAAALQDLSFVNPRGVAVSDFRKPAH